MTKRTNRIAVAIGVTLAAALAGVVVLAWTLRGESEEAPARSGEFAKSIEVFANVSRAPVVGETTLLAFSVESKMTYERATLTIELPSNMEFDKLPDGLRVTALSSPNPSRGGPRASGPITLEAGARLQFRARLRAIASGAAEISVRVTAPIPLGREGGADYVFFTVDAG